MYNPKKSFAAIFQKKMRGNTSQPNNYRGVATFPTFAL
jgi:hypothetical protein